MNRKAFSLPAVALASASVIGGAVGILAIAVRFLPALEDIRHVKEALELYVDYVRAPLLSAIGIDDQISAAAGVAVDLAIFWIAFFLAVNVFTYRREGWLLPSHIRNNHCQLRRSGILAAVSCVAPKLLVAFLAAPVVCVVYALTKLGAPRERLYSAAFITVQPREILHYILLIAGGAAAFLLIAQQIAGLYA